VGPSRPRGRVVYTTAGSIAQLQVGQFVETATRTIDQSDINAFAGLTGDWNPLHVSAPEARESPAGGIIASAMMVASMAVGLFAATRWLSAVIGIFVGITDWRAEAPVYAGDTVWARATLAELRKTSRGDGYLTSFLFEVFAERGQGRAGEGSSVRAMQFTIRFLCGDVPYATMPTAPG
jgi:3-hydroxybutyryl-CoA dehydratase